MRVRFQERPWDLYLLVAYTFLTTAILIEFESTHAHGILTLLFPPGYFLLSALRPGRKGIGWVERLTLAGGLGVVMVGLLRLSLQLTPIGIEVVPFTTSVATFTLLMAGLSLWRRIRLPPADRLSATVNLRFTIWKKSSTLEKIATIALLSFIMAATILIGFIMVTPHVEDRFTEFYVLGPGGKASDYPTRLNVSQSGTVFLGITNHETAIVNYTIRIDVVGIKLVYNSTTDSNDTLEQNRTTWSWSNATLEDSQQWIQPYTFRITVVGLWKVQFLLYKEANMYSAYSEVHFFVQVT